MVALPVPQSKVSPTDALIYDSVVSKSLLSKGLAKETKYMFSFEENKRLYRDIFRQLFSLKSKMGEKLISASCRRNFALSNWQCHHSYSFHFINTIFDTILLSMHPIVNQETLQKFNKTFQVSMNFYAVFHGESKYASGFKIQATYDELSSIFRKTYLFCKQ